MNLDYVKRTGVFDAFYTRTKLQERLEEFANNDADFAEMEYLPHEYVSPKSAYCAIHAAIKRFRYPFHVRMIQGRVYLDKNV